MSFDLKKFLFVYNEIVLFVTFNFNFLYDVNALGQCRKFRIFKNVLIYSMYISMEASLIVLLPRNNHYSLYRIYAYRNGIFVSLSILCTIFHDNIFLIFFKATLKLC